MSSTVWKFTNGRELNKSEFINYFERKVFRTIRKFQMLPENKTFTLNKSSDLNTIILEQILETKFQIKHTVKPNTDSSNLSQIAENTFQKITKGNFNYKTPNNAPLIYLSDKEVELYAKLKNIKGTKRKQDKKIQALFEKFLNKNQDLEINILNAQNQINKVK
jgi:spore coat protein CotH